MSPSKMTLITVAVGFAIASGVSALSLQTNTNHGNGVGRHRLGALAPVADSTELRQPAPSVLLGSNPYTDFEPFVNAD